MMDDRWNQANLDELEEMLIAAWHDVKLASDREPVSDYHKAEREDRVVRILTAHALLRCAFALEAQL